MVPSALHDGQVLRLIRDDRAWKVRTKTTAESIIDLYRAIRAAAGDDMVLLGCNAVNHLCAGIFDASRVGADTSGKSWEQTRRNGVGAVAFKGIENGTLFAADPDCAGLASAGAIPWEKNRQWIDLLSRSFGHGHLPLVTRGRFDRDDTHYGRCRFQVP